MGTGLRERWISILGTTWVCTVGCGSSPSAPNGPPLVSSVEIGPEAVSSDHRTVSIRYPSHGVTISGSLYLPLEEGRYPVVVWVHGSGRQRRIEYDTQWATSYVTHGFGFFSFDKRGVGSSGGECCPLDFPLLADDARAGVAAVREHPEIRTDAVGLVGVSQAGWIVPIAAAESPDIRFVVLQSCPTVTLGEESYFSELTKDGDCGRGGVSADEADVLVRQRGPSGFDPGLPILPG